jgi:hypothetical protein
MAALRGEHDETVPASLPGPSPGVLQALHDSGDTRDRLLAAQLLLAPKEVSLDYKKHYVRGVAYVTAISEQDIDDLQEKFMPRDTDVFVTTYPKCGTTWMQQICVLLKQGIASGSGHIDPGQKVDIGKESPWIDMSYPKLSLDDMQAMGNPRIFKTHAPFQLMPSQRDVVTGLPAEGKVVYVARNPKDACVSQFHHARCDEPPHFRSPSGSFTSPHCRRAASVGRCANLEMSHHAEPSRTSRTTGHLETGCLAFWQARSNTARGGTITDCGFPPPSDTQSVSALSSTRKWFGIWLLQSHVS